MSSTSSITTSAILYLSKTYSTQGEYVFLSLEDEGQVQNLLKIITGSETQVVSIIPQKESLEDYFMRQITSSDVPGGVA